MVKISTFLFFHWNRKSNIAIISSLAFTLQTKMSSDSPCPTLPLAWLREDSDRFCWKKCLFACFSETPQCQETFQSKIDKQFKNKNVFAHWRRWRQKSGPGLRMVLIGNQKCSYLCQICPSLNNLFGLKLCIYNFLPCWQGFSGNFSACKTNTPPPPQKCKKHFP